METFELAGHPFIQLNQLLKLMNYVESGGEANQVIVAGFVKVNGEVELQKRKKLFTGDKISYRGKAVMISE